MDFFKILLLLLFYQILQLPLSAIFEFFSKVNILNIILGFVDNSI